MDSQLRTRCALARRPSPCAPAPRVRARRHSESEGAWQAFDGDKGTRIAIGEAVLGVDEVWMNRPSLTPSLILFDMVTQ